MEYDNFKKIIYEWIQTTKFIDVTSESLESTNIDEFYKVFREKLTTYNSTEETVVEFLRAHYGSFEFHLDDSKEISSLDYVYIYSLMLHFSCVKYPDPYFHSLCHSLDETSQICIAKFFNLLLANKKFDRETIRATITAATPSSMQILSIDSPIKTSQQTFSPTTPRTMYLDDKRRELILLKAQLDSERYERSVVEMLLKQAEQKIEKMGNNQRKYIEEIQGLKNELLSTDTENRSPNKNYLNDQKNSRLQKDLLEKEERIIQLQLLIDNLMDDQNEVVEKLALNKTEISHWIEKTRELEQSMIDLRAEIDDKSEKIKCLQETNTELQNFFRENRGGIHGLDSLNTSSIEGLDYSFARMSSDISTSSPENLGRCVIDVQLKEKEMENNMLRDKLELLKHDYNRITTEIRNYCNSNSEMEPLEMIDPIDDYSQPLKYFEMCKAYFVEKLAVSDEFVKNLSVENSKLKEQINAMDDVHDELRGTISKLEHEFTIKERSFDTKISELQELILTKTSENTNLYSQVEKQQGEIKDLSTQLDKIIDVKVQLENENTEISDTLKELKELCESRYAEIESIGCQNDLLRVEVKELGSVIAQLESTIDDINRVNAKENSRLTTEIVELSRIVSSVSDENSEAEEKIQQLTRKLFQSEAESREFKDRITQISEREDKLIGDNQNLMEAIAKITDEKVLLSQKITEVTETNSKIIGDFKTSISDLKTENSQKESKIKELMETISQSAADKITMQQQIEEMAEKNLEVAAHLRDKITELTENLETLSKHNMEISERLTNTSTEKLVLIEKLAKLEEVEKHSQNQIAEILAEKSKLMQQVTDSKFDVSELTTEVVKLKCELESLTQFKESTTQSNLEQMLTIIQLQEVVQSLGADIENANLEKSRTLSQIERLDQMSKEALLKNVELSNEKNDLVGKIAYLEAQVQNLNEINEAASIAKLGYSEEVSKLQDGINHYKIQLEESRSEMDKSVKRINQLDQIVDEIAQKNTVLTNEKTELTNQLTKYHVDLANSEIRINELESEIHTLTETKKSIDEEYSEATKSIVTLNKECDQLKAELSQVNSDHSSAKARIEELTQMMNKNSQMMTEMSDEIEMLKSVNECITKEKCEVVKTLETEIENLNQSRVLSAEANSQQIETISKLNEDNHNLTSQLDKANVEIAVSSARIQELSQIIEERSVEITGLKTMNDIATQERTALTEKLAKFEADWADSEIKMNNLRIEIEGLIEDNDSSKKSISEYVETISKLQEGTLNLSEQVDTKNEEIRVLSNQVDMFKDQISLLVVEKQELDKVIDKNSVEIGSLKTANDVAMKKKDELIEQVDKFQVEFANLKLELQALTETNELNVKSNLEYADTVTKLEEESRNSTVQLSEANTKIEGLVARNEDLSKIVDVSSSKILELVNENEKYIEVINKLETDLANSDIRVAELTKELESLRKLNDSTVTANSEYNEIISQLKEEGRQLKNQLYNSNDELADAIVRIREVNEIAVKEKSELTERIEKLQSDFNISEARVVELNAEVCDISKMRDEIVSKLENQVSELVIQKDKLVEELRNATIEVQTLNRSTNLKVQTLNDLAISTNEQNAEIISNLEKSNEILTSEMILVQEANSRLVEEIDGFKIRVQTLTDSHNDELCKHETLVSELRKEKNDLYQTMVSLKEDSAKLNAQVTNSLIQIQKSSDTNSELEAKVEQLIKEKLDIQAKLDHETKEFGDNISKITTENTNLREQVTVAQAEVKQLTQMNESQIKELSTKNSELITEVEEQRTKMEKLRESNIRLTDELATSESKINELSSENKKLNEKVSALDSEIRVEKDRMLKKVEKLNSQIDNLVQNYETLQKDKSDLDVEVKITRSELLSLKESHSDAHTIKLALIEKEQTINSLEYNINKLAKEKLEKDKYIENLDQRLSQKEMEMAKLMHKLDESSEKDKLLNREKELNEKFTQDIAILKAKLYKHREVSEEREKQWNIEKEQLMAAIEEQKTAEERITENRLELVGKLEKMKTKMKTLYNEEMVKVKTKHENEISDLQKQAKEKFIKYDSHIEKLSKQIYQLNERNLGLEKDNKFLRTKIDFLEINTEVAGGSAMALNSMGSGGSRNLLPSTNLKMEDEEGEIFNNTYLTDLKTGGRLSPTSSGFGRDSVRNTELQHRNSLMPRHLRSTYAAQYGDQDLREEDLKDDDSLCSSMYGIQRKKISGATTYKRPGPPTPSKNAGRLSFGAVAEMQAREVLKENSANIPTRLSMTGTGFGLGGGNKRNTPGKLKSLFSNSTSKIKDDFNCETFDKSLTAIKSQLHQLLITSTPRRRSQVNRCRPRLSGHVGIGKIQKYTTRQTQIAAAIQSAGSIASTQFPIYQEYGEWRQPGSIMDSESCTSTSQAGSDNDEPPSREHNNSTLRPIIRRRSNKFTVKTSALTHSRTRYRMKSKENRLENFNRARRQSINGVILRKSCLGRNSTAIENNHPTTSDLVVEVKNQGVMFGDGEHPTPEQASFSEFEKLAQLKVSEAPFELKTPETTSNTVVMKLSSQKKRSFYSGGTIINRKIPRLSIRFANFHVLKRAPSNESSTRSFDYHNWSGVVARNWSHVCLYWQQYYRTRKILVIFAIGLLMILNFVCAAKFLFF